MRSSVVAVVLTLATATIPATARAGSKTHERSKIVGDTATAEWDYTAGNVSTYVNVIVTDNNEDGTAGPSETALVSLTINQWDNLTNNVLLAGVAYVDGPQNFDFSIDKDLGTATLHVRNAIFEDDNQE